MILLGESNQELCAGILLFAFCYLSRREIANALRLFPDGLCGVERWPKFFTALLAV